MRLFKVLAVAAALGLAIPMAPISTSFDSPAFAQAGKKKVKKAKKATKAKKGKKVKVKKAKAWKHCDTFMYHDKKGKCVDARMKK